MSPTSNSVLSRIRTEALPRAIYSRSNFPLATWNQSVGIYLGLHRIEEKEQKGEKGSRTGEGVVVSVERNFACRAVRSAPPFNFLFIIRDIGIA